MSRIGSLSQNSRKNMIAKWKNDVAKTNGDLAPSDRTFPLMKFPKELPTPYTITAYPTMCMPTHSATYVCT